jgi:DNA-binding NtrC family response regulator
MARILLVEDTDTDAELVLEVLGEAHTLVRAPSLARARTLLAEGVTDLLLLDLRLPDGNGLSLLEEVSENEPHLPVIFATAINDARSGIAALRGGARDYIVKDSTFLEELPIVVENVLQAARLETDHEMLRADATRQTKELALLRQQASRGVRSQLIGDSPAMQRLRKEISRAARCSETVAISGETGTGKELVAREIHAASKHGKHPFVAVNCAAIPESLIEAELFGYRRGAFTGADHDRTGQCERVGHGTLLLDEVAQLPLAVQAKLLRVIQEREYYPVGAERPNAFHARLISATNVELKAAIAGGSFRSDLYYRLYVVPVCLPPLRERREDIAALVQHFVDQYNQRNGTSFGSLSSAAVKRLMGSSWPGNVRELENLVIRVLAAADHSDGDVAVPDLVQRELADATAAEAHRILDALERHRWNRRAAAEELGLSRTTLWRRMLKHRLVGA